MNNFFPGNITKEEIYQLPLRQFTGRIIVADNPASMQGALNFLDGKKVLGFDTETKPNFKKGHINKVSLLQIADNDTCIIFRLNLLGFPDELAGLISDQSKLKIGLAVKDDINALSKLKHIIPAGFLDLQKYVENFGIADKSLKKLAALILGFRISKSQQVSNWESKNLRDSQLIYAATDAWICLKIYQRLQEIEKKYGKVDQNNIEVR